MTRTYLFKTDKGRFIINDEHSKIGYSYPRIFIESAKGYVNVDVTLGCCFPQSKSDFESWIDGEEISGASLDEVCERVCINKDVMLKMIDDFQTKNR